MNTTQTDGPRGPNRPDQRQLARHLVRAAFQAAAEIAVLPLATINKPRSELTGYRSTTELVREYSARAHAVADFAVRVGLLSVEEVQAIENARYDENDELLKRLGLAVTKPNE